MRLNEFLKGKKTVCTIFTDRFGAEYDAIFGRENYDVYIEVTYGNREVIPALTPENYEKVVGSVIAMRVNDWKQAAEAMGQRYNVIEPTFESTIIKNTNEQNRENRDRTESEAVYNDTEMQQGSGTKDVNNNTRIGNETITERKSGIITDIPELVRKEMSLRLLEWKKSIIFAIIKEITLSIY